jgi:UDP-2,3-diacylglucosamine hydrolase
MNVHATSDDSLATKAKAQPATVALFVSDIHLSPALPATTHAFLAFLQTQAKHAQQLYLLGDVFEYWAGDDDADDPYHRRILAALREVTDAGVHVFWIGGNRDFLVGDSFAHAAGLTLLPDPHVIEIANQRIVLTHGDAWCTDDAAYMAFRKQVRDPQWQQQFLAQPLAQRKQIVEAMRMGSKEAQRGKSMEIMDVNAEAIAGMFASCGADIMIHGHTHRPALHRPSVEGRACLRYVLPDWDCEGEASRGGWLALTEDGELHRLDVQGRRLD